MCDMTCYDHVCDMTCHECVHSCKCASVQSTLCILLISCQPQHLATDVLLRDIFFSSVPSIVFWQTICMLNALPGFFLNSAYVKENGQYVE